MATQPEPPTRARVVLEEPYELTLRVLVAIDCGQACARSVHIASVQEP